MIKINSLKIPLMAIMMVFVGFSVNAQMKVGDNPRTINPSSVFEMESTNKGIENNG